MDIIYRTELFKFMESNLRNAWIEYPDMKVYVRKGVHLFADKRHDTFDIANVEVMETSRGNGRFTAWLDMAETMAEEEGFEAIYVENLLNRMLAGFLERRGYTKTGDVQLPCYYLKY